MSAKRCQLTHLVCVLSRRISANTAVPGDAVWGGRTDGGVEHDGRAFGGQESEGTELLVDKG